MTTGSFCPNCGSNLTADERFCGTCGATLGAGTPAASAPAPRKSGPILLMAGALIAAAVVAFLLFSGGNDKSSGNGSSSGGGQAASLKSLRFNAPSGWTASEVATVANAATQFFAKDVQDLAETLRQPLKGPRIQVLAQDRKGACSDADVRPGLERDPVKAVSYGKGGKLKGYELQSPRKDAGGEWSVLLVMLCDSTRPATLVSVVYAVPVAMASANQGSLSTFLNSLEVVE